MTFGRETGATRRYRKQFEARMSEEERNATPEDYVVILDAYCGGDVEAMKIAVGKCACDAKEIEHAS